MSLSIKKSFAWSAVGQIGPKLIQFVITIVLARLLDPADFGLVGMLALFMGLAQVFADCGLSASVIQKQDLTADDETSVFALNIALGVVLTSLLCLISPLVAQFYEKPILIPILCVNALSLLISSFAIVQLALFTRHMNFHKTALVSVVSTIVFGISGTTMAYLGCGVWSLVFGGLINNIVRVGLLWGISDWRPRGRVRLQAIRPIWNFSSYLLYCQIIRVAYENMYSVVIGKCYSAQALGYFNRANKFRMLPATTMASVTTQVAFPLFSRCQHDKALLLRRLRELVRTSLMVSCSMLVLLALIANPLIPFLMTDK